MKYCIFSNNIFTSIRKMYFCTPFKKISSKYKIYGATQIVKKNQTDIKSGLRNRYYKKSARTSIAKLRSMTDKDAGDFFA